LGDSERTNISTTGERGPTSRREQSTRKGNYRITVEDDLESGGEVAKEGIRGRC